MTAQDFPITFDYGDTSPPYGTVANPYHRGQDRYMPDNTPIVINGNTTIGFSGHSGWVTGSHLHIGRWVAGKDTNPNGQGFTLKSPARVVRVGYDDVDGNYVCINDADGVQWCYLHMTTTSATIGQVIQPQKEDLNIMDRDAVEFMYLSATDKYPSDDNYAYWIGRSPGELAHALYNSNEQFRANANNYDKDIKALQDKLDVATALISNKTVSTTTAIQTAAKAAPTGTQAPWYVRLVAALTSKK